MEWLIWSGLLHLSKRWQIGSGLIHAFQHQYYGVREEKDQKEIKVCSILVLVVENEDIDKSKESVTVN